MRTLFDPKDPHAGQPVVTQGPKSTDARLTMILVHGRGASADDIIGLAEAPQRVRRGAVCVASPVARAPPRRPHASLFSPFCAGGAGGENRAGYQLGDP